jgi:exodeoxyribonuclease VII large subunit
VPERLHEAVARRLQHEQRTLAVLAARLDALDPARVLGRGYAWLRDGAGQAVTSVHALAPGQTLTAVLRDGRVETRVEALRPADLADPG